MLKLDLSVFERKARDIGGVIDQVPFALSRAMNDAVVVARKELVQVTWPRSVQVRNTRFLNAALAMEFSTKGNLKVAITDRLDRGNLALHATGGTKQARGRLAVPTKNVRRTAKGVVASQRPANLKRVVVKGGLIFQRQGSGKNERLRLMFKLQPTAQQPKDVPFYEDFAKVMRAEMAKSFPIRMHQAMSTRQR